MAGDGHQQLRVSILDRLIDLDPERSKEPEASWRVNLARIRGAVTRDLEFLLNTRRQILEPPPSFEEGERSVLAYGLRDFSSQNPASAAVRQQLRQEIERVIARFEPRLKNVLVRMEPPAEMQRNLRFRISALLVVDPIVEPVTFDTLLDVSRGQFVITR